MCQYVQTLTLTLETENLWVLLNAAEPHFLAGEPYTSIASLAADSFQEIIFFAEHCPFTEMLGTCVCSGSGSRKLLSHSFLPVVVMMFTAVSWDAGKPSSNLLTKFLLLTSWRSAFDFFSVHCRQKKNKIKFK